METTDRAGTFSGRVVVLFGTHVFGAAVGVINGLLARLLGPAGKAGRGCSSPPLQLGLPQAFGSFSARGQVAATSAGLLRRVRAGMRGNA